MMIVTDVGDGCDDSDRLVVGGCGSGSGRNGNFRISLLKMHLQK